MESLPFYEFWQQFVDDNREKNINILIGIGVSGETNPKEMYQFFRKKLVSDDKYKEDAYFILLIDPVYKISAENERFDEMQREHANRRKDSMIPFLELFDIPDGAHFQFQTNDDVPMNERYIKAIDTYRNYLYLWGVSLETGYNYLEKYSELRNNELGPYEYGKNCAPISEEHREVYDGLQDFFKQEPIKNIYVYNQFVQETQRGYLKSRRNKYTGTRFQNQYRVLREDNGVAPGRNETYSGLPYDNVYFERMCEFLNALWKSRKPVYILTRSREGFIRFLEEERIYQEAPNTVGGRQRKNRQTKKVRQRKSQSRRRRTV